MVGCCFSDHFIYGTETIMLSRRYMITAPIVSFCWGKFAWAIAIARPGCLEDVARASTLRFSGSGPPSTCPVNNPTTTNAVIAITAPLPTNAHTCDPMAIRIGTEPTSSIRNATIARGFEILTASRGAKARNATPSKSGARTVNMTMDATAIGDMPIGMPAILCTSSSESGTNTMDNNAAAVSNPITYGSVPPALKAFLVRIGGTGDIESVTSAIFVAG